MNWKRIFWPLQSRKVQVALATVVAAWATQWGLNWSEDKIMAIVGVGVALILGIAHEDAGAKVGLPTPPEQRPPTNP